MKYSAYDPIGPLSLVRCREERANRNEILTLSSLSYGSLYKLRLLRRLCFLSLILLSLTACVQKSKSVTGRFLGTGTVHRTPGSEIEKIHNVSDDQVKATLNEAFSYYIVGLNVHHPWTSYTYSKVADGSSMGSGVLDPPIGQTCNYSDPKQCANEHKWRQVAQMPCNVEIQLVLFATDSTGIQDIGGDKFIQDCALHYRWSFFSN
jgi:hypothetical protein